MTAIPKEMTFREGLDMDRTAAPIQRAFGMHCIGLTAMRLNRREKHDKMLNRQMRGMPRRPRREDMF